MERPVIQLDHVAIHVREVAVSEAFYRDVMGLRPLPRPAFDFPGAWFALGPGQELHLIGDRDLPVHSNSRGTHFALQVTDLDAWESVITELGAEHLPRRTRPDGAQQLFVCDPDGHWIELCQKN
ncbi:MAG: VOC family protein [Planctomycetota bacterium]